MTVHKAHRSALSVPRPNAARNAVTFGQLEQLAGIGTSEEERYAFWKTFVPYGANALDAARDELYRRIAARLPAKP
ncbi:MAG: hypothetical protein M9924_22045 [Rhizobiaceae bacterium]|nr:hypothetical protein [Rhizobiaceae bacterium]